MAITTNDRAYGVSKYCLDIEGRFAGFVKELSGGDATADVVLEKIGADHLQKKHLGNVKYEEVVFKCGTGMTKDLYDWIDTAFSHTFNAKGRKDGALIFMNYDQQEVSRLTWHFGIITELGMPALDASSKDSAMMTVKFKPEFTRKTWSTGPSFVAPTNASKQKKWLPANFRLRIDGCELGCAKVNKIEALTVQQKVAENSVGEQRDYQFEGTSVSVPNLVITLPESHADEFYRWHEDFVIKGNNGEEHEKGGTLEYLTPNLSEVLFTLNFFHLGVFKVTADKNEAAGEPIRRLKVEMYCEDIRFNYSANAVWSG
jgi:phage tail-like protein